MGQIYFDTDAITFTIILTSQTPCNAAPLTHLVAQNRHFVDTAALQQALSSESDFCDLI